MPSRRYAHVSPAWEADVDLSAPQPGRFLARLVGQALRYGLPASRRFGAVRAAVARRGVPEGVLAGSFRAFPRRARPDVDDLVAEARRAWTDLAERSSGLPPSAPRLSALALERAAGLTVFLFGAPARPLVVLKVPKRGDPRPDEEQRALEEAEPAAVGPRALGRVGAARAQEGLDGEPLKVEPLDASRVAGMGWSGRHAVLAAGLSRLGETTAKGEPPAGLFEPVERALRDASLSGGCLRVARAAWRDVAGGPVSVLQHGDASPQNCLFDGTRLCGLVDWERSDTRGVPGFDAWTAALSYLEHGVGLLRWSEGEVAATFEAAWDGFPFGRAAHQAAARCVAAAAVPDRLVEPLEVVFFLRRLGRRLERPGAYATGPGTAARMLESICAR